MESNAEGFNTETSSARGNGGTITQMSKAVSPDLEQLTRDFRAFHRMLRARGLAVRAGEPLLPPKETVPDDLAAVVARIRALGATVVPGSG